MAGKLGGGRMPDLGPVLRRTVQDAYEAWTASVQGEPGADPGPISAAASVRPVRFVSWEELEEVAEAPLDLEDQVMAELARMPGGRTARRQAKIRLLHRRIA